jgi:hypothetical protein
MKVNNETSISNGNVNSSRATVNNNASRMTYLGSAKRFSWNAKRSYRAI